ncbi:G-protein coupled receptor family C group 5 member D isoform X1 [Oryzias latipes]|uniref:G protein-coupled receptor class C group 5 member D n=1 Tax=Oryzias latipes TaxID=8090 RepID=A0A3B3I7L4_ORYLA|nr:G-protein coupled receptor family C group 5 member D isoform X1 [Oryzias latipes]
MAFSIKKSLWLVLVFAPLICLSQSSTNSSVSPASSTFSSNNTYLTGVRGCGAKLDPIYRFLCDRRAAWGIVVEALASTGFLFSAGLLFCLLVRFLCTCASSCRLWSNSFGGTVLCISLFLLATAGIFATTFSFIIQHTQLTCPARIFLFSVLFSLAFSCLLARCLAMLGFAAARGWGEAAMALGLSAVQVIISTQWLIIVLVRDKKPCEYSQPEFAMLQIYVLCLMVISLIMSFHILCRSCSMHSYSYTGPTNQQWRMQAALICITLLLSASIWVVWIAMLTRGNLEIGRQPTWDDPVLSIALVANGWVLLMGHGLVQVAFFCSGEANSNDIPLNFRGWTSSNPDTAGPGSPNGGRENGRHETESNINQDRTDPKLRSPYESGFSMEEIDPAKDYTIPRPKTTNYTEPYD